MRADYVIVGGGSAGAVLANRLSADPTTRVALVEAGGEANGFIVQLPVGYAKMLTDPKIDWCYEQESDASINGRSWIWSAGKMLGGSSSINGQVYIRGPRSDFDRWKKLGATGWAFADVFPYFLRSEHWLGEPSQAHGSTGPLAVTQIRDPHPLCNVFLQGCSEVGLPTLDEHNDGSAFGAFLTQTNQIGGWRCSTERAYLRPIRKRSNLEIITHAEVDTIRIEQGRAAGVSYTRQGARHELGADREVIVCAGAIGSPALLMRSGVGPAAHLREHGVPVVHDAPEVGRNLQEHSGVSSSRRVSARTLNMEMGPLDMMRHFAKFFWNRSGPLGAPPIQARAFASTRPGRDEPDVQLHFAPLAADLGPEVRSPGLAVLAKDPAVTIYASLCKPHGRGRIELGREARPRIMHSLVGDERDLSTLTAGMRLVDRIYDSPAFAPIVTGHRSPAERPQTDGDWEAHIRAVANVTWHAVGTCRMGSDPTSVVDPELKLRGVDRIRVVDASVMPTPTSGNTNAATIMIGEKGASLVEQSR